MAHVIIGTAGHIDHGKTALVKALTGIETDTLPEERDRGVTIDIGFAYWKDNVTIIDVPGHERFVKNMVTGVCTVDLALFVVAADDGVMPQTRERLSRPRDRGEDRAQDAGATHPGAQRRDCRPRSADRAARRGTRPQVAGPIVRWRRIGGRVSRHRGRQPVAPAVRSELRDALRSEPDTGVVGQDHPSSAQPRWTPPGQCRTARGCRLTHAD